MPQPDFTADLFKQCSWLACGKRHEVRIGSSASATDRYFNPNPSFSKLFPGLSFLLSSATITPVTFANETRLLFGWRRRDGRTTGWLCELSNPTCARADLHPHHVTLLRHFGGIREYWRSESKLLANQNSVFLEENAAPGFNSWEEYLIHRCSEEGIPMPIKPNDFMTFAIEANGNSTSYHKISGEVVLFASDHCFDYVTQYPGSPDMTLFRINQCDSFRNWIEVFAAETLGYVDV